MQTACDVDAYYQTKTMFDLLNPYSDRIHSEFGFRFNKKAILLANLQRNGLFLLNLNPD